MPSRVRNSIPCGTKSSSSSTRDLRLTSSFLKRRSWRLRSEPIRKSLSSRRMKCIAVRLLAPNSKDDGDTPPRNRIARGGVSPYSPGDIPQHWGTAASAASISSSAKVVGEIPSAQLAWFQTDDQVVACGLGVPLTPFGAEVTRGYATEDRSVFGYAEARPRAKLEAAVGRAIYTDDD